MSFTHDDSEAWINTPPSHLKSDPRLTPHRRESNARAISRCLPSMAIGSLGLVLIGVALRGGAPGVEAVRPWQDQAHNITHCSPSSQAQARCAPAHPAHPVHPAVQGLARTGTRKMNASRAPPRSAAALPRASATALARPAAALAKPAAAPSRPAVALPRPATATEGSVARPVTMLGGRRKVAPVAQTSR